MAQITWLGWSGFRIEAGGQTVLVDAHKGGLEPHPSPPPTEWGTGADFVVVSHGHYDHSGSTDVLLRRNPTAPFVSSPIVVDFARQHWGLEPTRPTYSELKTDSVSVELLPGVHYSMPRHRAMARSLRWSVLSPSSMRRLMAQMKSSPGAAPVRAVRIGLGGLRVLHACEVVHRRTDFQQAASWVGGEPLDVFLVGVEPGEERAALRLVATLKPTVTILFSPHQESRDWFDKGRARAPRFQALAQWIRDLPFEIEAHVAVQDQPVRPLAAAVAAA